jgi:hypothetical protein
VSKILWHFTGGPRWNAVKKVQYANPKPPEAAFNALRGIITSRKVLLGRYREVVKVKVATRVLKEYPPSKWHPSGRKLWLKGPEEVVERESAPVCCLADIPVAHLSYHAGRYGWLSLLLRPWFGPFL